MNYNSSVSDFFKSPKWGMNAMLSAVALIIPLIGPIVLGGWHVTGFWARGDQDDPESFPDMDFAFFIKYLERGLWPFLVNLVASLVMVPVIMILMVPLIILMPVFEGENISRNLIGLLFIGFFCIQITLTLLYQLYLARGGEAIPLSLKLRDLPPALPPIS